MNLIDNFFIINLVIFLIILFNVFIFNSNESVSSIFIKEIKSVYIFSNPNTTQDEWIDIENKFYFRTQTAEYLQDEKRIHILMMNNKLNYLNFDFIFNIELFYDSKPPIEIQTNNTQFNIFLRDAIYEDLELTAPLDIHSLLDSNQEISELNMILKIILYKKNSTNLYGTTQPVKVNIKNWLPTTPIKDIYICTKDLYLDPGDYKNFEWWVEMNVRNGFTKIVIMNNSIPDTAEFRNLFNVYKDKIDVINYNKLPNLMNLRKDEKYFSHMKDLIFGPKRPQVHKYGVEYMSFHECVFRYSDKADLILLIDPDEIFIPVKLENFENELVTYELVKGLNLADENFLDVFYREFLSKKKCKQRVRFNLYSDDGYLRDFVDNVYATNNIPTDYSIYFQSVSFIGKDIADAIFEKLTQKLEHFNINQQPMYPLRVILNFIFNGLIFRWVVSNKKKF